MKREYFNLIAGLILISCIGLKAQTVLSSQLCNETLTLANSPYMAHTTVVVPQGCSLKVEPGVEIRMAQSAFLIIRGQAEFRGTVSQPVYIHAKDTSWGLIYLDNTGTDVRSVFDHVVIRDATIGPHGTTHEDSAFQVAAISGWGSGAEISYCIFTSNLMCVYFYDCPNTVIKSCRFDIDNIGEKIHIERCDHTRIDSCEFFFTAGLGDVIDIDGSDSCAVSHCCIFGGDGDAIDVGNSDSTGCRHVEIAGNFIWDMGDKGVSAGERCTDITIHHNVILGCDLGISAKAGAVAYADHNTLYGNRIGVRACDCLAGWGPGSLEVTNSIIAGSADSTFVVSSAASLAVSYSLSDVELIPGTGNIMGDPLFVSAVADTSGDFHLTAASPAIDQGDPAAGNDPDGTRNDIGAHYFNKAIGISSVQGKKMIRVFPNPARHSCTVVVDSEAPGERFHVSIIDMHGHKVSAAELTHKRSQINIAGIRPGIYIIEMLTENKLKFVERIVIE